MDFVESGVAGGDGERGEGPSPAPAGARTAHTAKKQEIENEVFREVRTLANVVMIELNLSRR